MSFSPAKDKEESIANEAQVEKEEPEVNEQPSPIKEREEVMDRKVNIINPKELTSLESNKQLKVRNTFLDSVEIANSLVQSNLIVSFNIDY